MISYCIKVLQNYAVFTGRARRAEYWYFALATCLLQLVVVMVMVVLGVVALTEGDATLLLLIPILSVVTNLLYLAVLIPTIAVGVRRMHDVDMSGWFLLVPFYNLYLAVQPGTVGPNRFGPDPIGGGVPVPVPIVAPAPAVE